MQGRPVIVPVRRVQERHVDDARARIHRVGDTGYELVDTVPVGIHAGIEVRESAERAGNGEVIRVGDHRRVRRDALDAGAAVIALPVAHDQGDHVGAMGHVEPVGSAQRHVPLRHDPVLVVYVVARVAMRERQPVRHVRVRQGRIVPHDLVVDHRDLHALARQSGIPRVAHAHVLDAPVDRPVRRRRPRAQSRAQARAQQAGRQRRHHTGQPPPTPEPHHHSTTPTRKTTNRRTPTRRPKRTHPT